MPTSLSDVVQSRSRGCNDLPSVANAVCDAYRARVRHGFACFATMDPATGLISSATKTRPLEIGDEEFAAAEYGGPDLNLFSEISARPEPVGALSVDTGGEPDRCRRMRDFLRPRFGFSDELRVAFRSRGLLWGGIAMYREAGDPPFTDADTAVAVSVHSQVAELIQAALFHAQSPPAKACPGPAVVVVGADDRVVNLTPAAEQRVAQLGGWDSGSLPATVLVSVAAARAEDQLAVNRAVGTDGSWVTIRATSFAAEPGGATVPDVVVTLDSASAADVSDLALSAHGLSPREQEVTGLVLRGASTSAIAASLHLSPHTVQDHLKSVFAKLGVNSRRALVQRLVVDAL
ncbi:response regulator transcription factor [Jatrophihabitans sp. YIM 134969]